MAIERIILGWAFPNGFNKCLEPMPWFIDLDTPSAVILPAYV